MAENSVTPVEPKSSRSGWILAIVMAAVIGLGFVGLHFLTIYRINQQITNSPWYNGNYTVPTSEITVVQTKAPWFGSPHAKALVNFNGHDMIVNLTFKANGLGWQPGSANADPSGSF